MERRTGRPARAWNPPKGSEVDIGDNHAVPIRYADEWIVEFEDGGGPVTHEDERGRKWWYGGTAFHSTFESLE